MGIKEVVGVDEITVGKGNLIWRALLAEFIGNLLLNFFGCASVLNFSESPSSQVLIALTFGFTIFIIVHTLAHVSGGNFNPAVTLGLLATGNIHAIKALLYIVAQCLGAAAGSAILKAATPEAIAGNLGNTQVTKQLSPWSGLIYEVFLGFILLFAIFGVIDQYRPETKTTGALAIGLAVAIGHLVAVDATGASMNPARSFGSALVTGQWDHHWVFWVGPILGGVIASLLYTWVFADPAKHPQKYSGVDTEDKESVTRA